MSKTCFDCVRNWRWPALAHIFIWLLRTSTTLLLYTFSTVVALVLSLDKSCSQNAFFCKLLWLVSDKNPLHAETSFCVSQIPFNTRFSTRSRSILCFACLSLPPSYSSELTSAQAYTQALACSSCLQSTTMQSFRDTSSIGHFKACTSVMLCSTCKGLLHLLLGTKVVCMLLFSNRSIALRFRK